MNRKLPHQNTEATEGDDERKRLQEFFSLDPDTDMVEINAFMQSCKEAKYSYHNQTIFANSVHQANLDDIVASDFEKRSIIPEEGVSRPSPEISHLSKNLQEKIKDIVGRHEGLFSKNKHHLGRFTGFKAVAHMDTNSKVNCRQPPRNRVLPPSCKADLLKYKKSGLFEHSTGGSDDYCSNLTLVLRNQVREQRSNTKADKNLLKNTKNAPQPPSKVETQPLPNSDLAKPEKSLYRMTIDFRSINLITLNEKTSQLPSIQAIENNFHNAIVSTIDLSNCYPSIEIEENSRNFFNFYVENEVWQHRRLAQGWSASLAIAQRAVLWTFRDQALLDFMASRNLTAEQFPFKAYREFTAGFVDDLSIFSSKDFPMSEDMHCLCLEAVFYALHTAGWVVKLEVSTFLNPHFVFLGLKWNLNERSSLVQNDRVAAIINHRSPRSLPELASRLATLNYYQNFIPLMKRLAIPLYKIIKEGKFVWGKVQAEAYGNLLYLMSLQIRNHIFDPTNPIMAMCDTSALETSIVIFQWNPETLSLVIITTKSILLTTALRRQSPVHREGFGVDKLIDVATPYLFQSLSPVNYLFNDASSIAYISRNKPFSSFLQTLSEKLSMFPSLVVIHLPGRALWFCDILSRQYDHVSMERTDTNISKEQAALVPSIAQIKPGAVLTNKELLDLFATSYGPEVLDVSDTDYRYVQKINWEQYTNPAQYFTSEREFLIGGLIGKLNPELSLHFPTLQDIFRIKENGSKLKTKAQKLSFVQQCAESLQKLPYDSTQLQKVRDFLTKKAKEYNIKSPIITANANFVRHTSVCCNCMECKNLSHISIGNTIINATDFVLNLEKAFTTLNIPEIEAIFKQFHNSSCKRAKSTLAAVMIDKAIHHCTSSDDIQLDHSPLFVFSYNLVGQDISLQFDGGKVHFISGKMIPLDPGQILEIPLDFVTNIQNIPDLDSDICEAIAVSPCIQFVPQLTIPAINLANCTTSEYIELPKDTILLTLSFTAKQVLGIFRDLQDILSTQQIDRNIVNFSFLKYTSQAVAKIATEGYKKDISSFRATSTKKKKKPVPATTQPAEDCLASAPHTAGTVRASEKGGSTSLSKETEVGKPQDDIFTISDRDKHTVLQSATLIHGLLRKIFSSASTDIQELQFSDLKLRSIYERTKDGKMKNFVIISKILYKCGKDESKILCMPDLLCRQVVKDSHSKSGFHFKIHQLNSILRPLIYHPDLPEMIVHTVKHCLICTLTPSKRVRKLIGAQRSNIHTPGQCIVADSLFLPRSTYGYTKALIIVDSATGYVIVYPSKNLLASTVRKHFLMYLCSHPPPETVKADFGGEFCKDLEGFFANYGIQLDASMPYAKGSTSAAESAISVVKGALRQLCLAHTATWPELLPTMLQAINSQGLYGSSTSRAQLYFSPYSWQNSIKLNKLLFPEALFSENYDKLQFIINKRQTNLTKRHIKDSTEYQKGNLVFAINVPKSKTEDGSSELRMTVEDLYYCHKVFPRHLRLIGVFTGITRNLPRELCQKVGIQQLAKMQFQIKSHHLQKLSDSMMRANKFVGPDNARTWQYLMGRDPTADVRIDQSEEQDYNQPQAPDQKDAQVDVFGTPNNEPAQPGRKTRSGRAYAITSSLLPNSILRNARGGEYFQTDTPNPDCDQLRASARAHHHASLRGLINPSGHLGIVSDSTSSRQEDVPTNKTKSVSWDTELTVKFINQDSPEEETQTYRQVCINQDEVALNPVIYVMTNASTIDYSLREFFYKTYFSKPMAANIIEEENEDIYD